MDVMKWRVGRTDRSKNGWKAAWICLLISLLLHQGLLVPGLVRMLSARSRKPDDRKLRRPVTVTLERPDLRTPRPAIVPDSLRKPEKERMRPPRKATKKKVQELKEKAPEKKPPEKKPQARPPQKRRKQPPPAPPKKEEVKIRLKMVHQENPKDEQAPKKYRFLAQKNRNVEKETRARKTVLHRVKPGPTELAPGKRTRADLREKPGPRRRFRQKDRPKPTPRALARKVRPKPRRKARPPRPTEARLVRKPRKAAPASVKRLAARPEKLGPHPEGKRPVPRPPEKPSILSMRRPAVVPAKDLTLRKLIPTPRQVARLFAVEWRKEAHRRRDEHRRAGRLRASRDPSATRWKRIRAAIENYIPEVKPGRVTALRTRAHPFAAYIAKMHRSIHPLWGDGFLADWDLKSSSDPMNVSSRWAMIEIVLNRDGTLNKAGLVKFSGLTAFDAAALDVVFTAAPFGKPPTAILSADKKVYLHWRFHRDQRQCGTFGVNAFILTHPPKGRHIDRKAAAGDPDGARWDPARVLRRLRRAGQSPGRVTVLKAQGSNGPASSPRRSSGGTGTGTGTGPGPSAETHTHAPGQGRAAAPATGSAGSAPAGAPTRAARPEPPAAPNSPGHGFGEAGSVAGQWLSALVVGDVERLAALSGVPFKANGVIAAKNAAALKKAFKALVAELRAAGVKATAAAPPIALATGSGLRRKLGMMPKGLDGSATNLFAMTRIGKDRIILTLTIHGKTYRVTGLQH